MQPLQRELVLDDYLRIARRRLWWIVLPTIVATLLAVGVSYVLKPKYQSKTLILVELPTVPENYVKSVVNEDLNGRLARMNEQIFSRTRLQPIVEHFGLFADTKMNADEKIEQLRKDIVVMPIKSDALRGAPGFSVSTTLSQPRVAQQVCGEVASMFLSENLKLREQSAEGTTAFLQAELGEAKRSLDQQDAALAGFQRQYFGELPGQEQTNMNLLTAANTQLEAATQAISRLEQEKSYTESMLAQQTETSALVQGKVDTPPPPELDKQIEQLQTQLISLEAKYTPNHPDVVKTRRELATLRKQAEAAPATAPATGGPKTVRDTPAELRLRAQVQAIDGAIAQKKADQERMQQQIRLLQTRIQSSPTVQEKYKELTRDYDTAQKFYNDMLAKKTQSEMATELERRQEGEQFRMIDPPNMPLKPSFPNRLLFAAGGLVAGLCLGGGLGALMEFADHSLRNERDVMAFTKLETLAMVPRIAAAMPPRPSRLFWFRAGRRRQQFAERVVG